MSPAGGVAAARVRRNRRGEHGAAGGAAGRPVGPSACETLSPAPKRSAPGARASPRRGQEEVMSARGHDNAEQGQGPVPA
eukprot:676549-Pyramimonas_sp.AAC.1